MRTGMHIVLLRTAFDAVNSNPPGLMTYDASDAHELTKTQLSSWRVALRTSGWSSNAKGEATPSEDMAVVPRASESTKNGQQHSFTRRSGAHRMDVAFMIKGDSLTRM